MSDTMISGYFLDIVTQCL